MELANDGVIVEGHIETRGWTRKLEPYIATDASLAWMTSGGGN